MMVDFRFNRKDNLLRHKKTHIANAALIQNGTTKKKRHNMLNGVHEELLEREDESVDASAPATRKKPKKETSLSSMSDR